MNFSEGLVLYKDTSVFSMRIRYLLGGRDHVRKNFDLYSVSCTGSRLNSKSGLRFWYLPSKSLNGL